jgi:hypothetical protein
MLRKVLYILSKDLAQFSDALLPKDPPPDNDISVILIQEGVSLKKVPGTHIYVLSDDAVSRNVVPSFPTISYRAMLEMIFDADAVVAL